jgi:hypothetical protein
MPRKEQQPNGFMRRIQPFLMKVCAYFIKFDVFEFFSAYPCKALNGFKAQAAVH